MNATSRTMVFVGVATVAALAAAGVRYANRPVAIEGFSDMGQEFYADFQDPLKALELSVVKYDAETKEPQTFSVRQNDKGMWVIPSHHDYPAEAAERLAKTAASLIGVKKLGIRSRSKEDWGRYGVEDPSAEVAASASAEKDDETAARGTRITLRDSSSNALVDLIVGKPVENLAQHFFVRQPDKNPVFITKLDVDLSAKFADWIEPDLLKLNQNDIVKVVVDQYSVDEEQGAILQGEKYDFDKDAKAGKWAMAGLDLNVESLKEAAVTDITRNLDQLKIVGVRPKPEGLNADLTVSKDVAQNPLLQKVLQTDMQRQGFYIARGANDDVKLVSNEGELIAGTNNGVKYTLYFGEIARGTAKDIETGLNDPKADAENKDGEKAADEAKAEEKPADKPAGPDEGPRRYLLVKVEFDESLLGEKPAAPVAPEKPAVLNDGTEPAPPESKPADEPKAEADATPKEEAPTSPEPAKEASVEEASDAPAKEQSPDPGSCDEPAAAEPAVTEPTETAAAPQSTEPAAPEAPAPAAETPATTETPAPENPAPAAEAPATPAAPGDDAAPAAQPPVDPKVEAQKQYEQALGEFEAAKAGFEGAVKSWEGRSAAGKKKAEELESRFGSWYYVISAESFEKFKLSRDAVVGPKDEPKPADGPAIPGAGSIPNFDLPGLGN